jgi:hypothetical protein
MPGPWDEEADVVVGYGGPGVGGERVSHLLSQCYVDGNVDRNLVGPRDWVGFTQ